MEPGQYPVLFGVAKPILDLNFSAGNWVYGATSFTVPGTRQPIIFSRTSLATLNLANGLIDYAINNVLLNTATLSTQSVTSLASPYILSFTGTGSVTASGTASFTLNGTGVNNRVQQVFTPTAGSLTLTVSGSVTLAQLEAHLATPSAPAQYVGTAGSPYYGPRQDYSTGTPAFVSEQASTNTFLNSATGATQSVTTTAAPWTLSFYGTGSVALSGAYTGSLAGTGTSTRVSLTFTSTAAPLTLTVTGSITNVQLEALGFATSYIPTGASAVSRSADTALLSLVGVPYNFSQGTWAYKSYSIVGEGSVQNYALEFGNSVYVDSFALLDQRGGTSFYFNPVWSGAPGSGQFGSYTLPTLKRAVVAYSNSFKSATCMATGDSGVTTHTGTSSMPATPTQVSIGVKATGAYANQLNGWIYRLQYYPQALLNAKIMALVNGGF